MFLEFVLLTTIAVYLFYRWSISTFDFFEKRGIPFHKPFPLFGSMKDAVFHKTSMFDLIVQIYNKHSGKIYGVFDQRIPVYLIRDPELVKQITIKDFDHFVNHRTVFADTDENNLFGNSLFVMEDGRWKDMRSTLSPAFTGCKLRQMFDLMNHASKTMVEYLKKENDGNPKGIEIDAKEYTTRFTNDVIASTAFGLQIDSFNDKHNEFYTMGRKVTTFTTWQNIKFFMFANFKKIMRLLKIELFSKEQTRYFMRLVLDAMKYRKEHNVFRPDMINMLMEASGMIHSDNQKSHNRNWSDIEIVSQCFLFFFAGFETAATLMCFISHELMENPDIQQKLFEEIEEASADSDNEFITYEKIQDMKYLDMVVSEALRKWPAAIALDRLCNKDFVYKTEDGERIEIKKGENIWIPVCGIHRDPQYYENPNKFDPERFSEENKDKIDPFTYLPFGMGPRNCIGSRFALLEAKAMIFYVIRQFKILPAAKSTIPLELTSAGFQMIPKTGFWLKFVPRKI